MTKWDKILIVAVIFFALIGMFWIKEITTNNEHLYLIIEVDGEAYKKISLDGSDVSKTIEINTKYGHSVIEIDGKGARFLESDCKDQLCVKMGKITKSNQTSICLPNRVSIKLISEKSDVDIVSY
ncbi:NusG domain II-containing protein [Crassaminicella profunda]|uniref:NusG domain II-containing protein n=1 Tax=Crassaminicella profunda TaxID=1286698 RepID=UPI001CA6B3D1|nr:NusG domain II-containing protein [Crassaminicella profunda]QZY56597.1 NusG domain II-containing protein [Crassaminicella profunda]